MSQNIKRIAVLMTCYNRVSTTIACLRRLFAQELPCDYDFDVYLVDDDSPDETGSIVQKEFPSVEVIKGGGLFWCRGMRLAWDTACSKEDVEYMFFLWLNDDVILKGGALKSLILDYEHVRERGDVESVLVGTFSSTDEERDVSYCVSANGEKVFPNGQYPILADGDFNGNLVLIPEKVFRKVGPIYNGYYHAFGDYDYSMLLRRQKVKTYASSRFSGVCPEQPQRYLHLRGRNLFQRIKLLFNPKGFCIHDAFLYRYRRAGLFRACLSVVHVVLIVIFAREGRK